MKTQSYLTTCKKTSNGGDCSSIVLDVQLEFKQCRHLIYFDTAHSLDVLSLLTMIVSNGFPAVSINDLHYEVFVSPGLSFFVVCFVWGFMFGMPFGSEEPRGLFYTTFSRTELQLVLGLLLYL